MKSKLPQTKRQARYGKLVEGWNWRTLQSRLDVAEKLRLAQGIGKTELLERAIDEYIARHSRKAESETK